MKRLSLCTGILSCLLSFAAEAQEKSGSSFGDRLFFGGNFGLQFGNVTAVDISPMAGYKVTDQFGIGVGVSYLYLSDRDLDFSTSMYGGRVFARHILFERFFAHAEYEVINREVFEFGQWRRKNVVGVYVGGGFRERIGANSFFTMTLLYNLNETIYSPISNPLIRAGIVVGM